MSQVLSVKETLSTVASLFKLCIVFFLLKRRVSVVHCFVFGKSARNKIFPYLGCFFRDTTGVADHISFNWGSFFMEC